MTEKCPGLSSGCLEIRIPARPEYLCIIRDAFRKACLVFGMAERDVDSVILALDEAMTNVIRHSYGGPCTHPMIISIHHGSENESDEHELEIILRDYGKQVDPTSIRSRDLEDIRPGGLGVHIIRSIMDEMEYSCPVDGGMRLRMVKRFQPVEQEAPLKH